MILAASRSPRRRDRRPFRATCGSAGLGRALGRQVNIVELRASPSASRTMGRPTTSTGTFRSETIFLMMASCCQSLLAEYGKAGLGQHEQFQDHRTHAPEVDGAAEAAQGVGKCGHFHPCGVIGARTCFPARGIEYVRPARGPARSLFKIARVRFQILVGAELRRIDEKADDHLVGHRAGIGNQAGVPGVVIPHRGHKGRFQPLTPPLGTRNATLPENE